MTVRLASQTPESYGLIEPSADLIVTLTVETTASSRTLSLLLGVTPILAWVAGVATFATGYAGSVTLTGDQLVVVLQRLAGWTSGAAIDWTLTYSDSLTSSTAFTSSFAQVTATLTSFRPEDGASGVSRRPLFYAEATFSAGTPAGVDLDIAGAPAIFGGRVSTPEYIGRVGSQGLSPAFGLAQPRRNFSWGQRVTVIARPRVLVSSTAYRGAFSRTFTVTGRSARTSSVPDIPPQADPVRETLRQLANSTLRPDGGSPPIGALIPYYTRRTVVGQLVGLAEATPSSADIPATRDLFALVEHVKPLWTSLLHGAPSEYQESLHRAWTSGHVAEQVGALCVILSLSN